MLRHIPAHELTTDNYKLMTENSHMKLAGKVAVVTGTSPNIGGGIATGLAEEGAKLVCVDIRADYAERCAKSIRQRSGDAIAVTCDVTDDAQVCEMVQQAGEAFGGIDILVNNAVIFNQKGVLDMPLDEWSDQIAVILTGAFLCTKRVSNLMIEQGTHGSIINIISTAGHQGQPGNVGYCTGKSGLLNFTRSVAMELAPHGIRVNSLTPTATDPGEAGVRSGEWGLDEDERGSSGPGEHFLRGVPMGKLPRPSHYARAAAFLASDDAEMITGIDLRVDAGAVARYWAWTP